MSAVARVITGGKKPSAPAAEPAAAVPPQETTQPGSPNQPGSPAQRDESDLAARTSASLRARRRGGGRQSLLGTSDTQSTLG